MGDGRRDGGAPGSVTERWVAASTPRRRRQLSPCPPLPPPTLRRGALPPLRPLQSQLSSFALVPGRASCIVRAADQEAALELLRPSHLLCAQLRGFLFFGVSHAISTRLHAAARRLDAGLHGAEEGVGQEEQWAGGASGGANGGANGGGSAWRAQQAAAADRLYTREGSKHGGALWAAANAPKFLLLDFTRVKGIDATAARTLGSLFR